MPLQAEKTSRKAQLADRLVNGLSGENKRWSETISKMEVAGSKLVSTAVESGAFVVTSVCSSTRDLVNPSARHKHTCCVKEMQQ